VGIYGSVSRRAGDVVGSPFFSKIVGYIQLCWVNVKGCRVQLVMSACVSCVSDFSSKMYIDSNRRDSRI
jgi:hypothetical protein